MEPQSPGQWYLIELGDIVWRDGHQGTVLEMSVGHETIAAGRPWGGTKPNGEGYLLADFGKHGKHVIRDLGAITMDPAPFEERSRSYLSELTRENRAARKEQPGKGGNMETQTAGKPAKKTAAKADKPAKTTTPKAKPVKEAKATPKAKKETAPRLEPPEGFPYTIAEAARRVPLSKLSMRKYVGRILDGAYGNRVPHQMHQGVPRFSDASITEMQKIKAENEARWGPKDNRE